MRERDRLFKRYCNEYNTTLKVAKHNKYKNARNLVIFKVKKKRKRNIISFIFKSIQKMFKNLGRHQILHLNYRIEKDLSKHIEERVL